MKNGKHNYGGWFHFKGEIIEGKDDQVKLRNGASTFACTPINQDFSIAFRKDSALSFFSSKERLDMVQIEFLTNCDWVIGKELDYEF